MKRSNIGEMIKGSDLKKKKDFKVFNIFSSMIYLKSYVSFSCIFIKSFLTLSVVEIHCKTFPLNNSDVKMHKSSKKGYLVLTFVKYFFNIPL